MVLNKKHIVLAAFAVVATFIACSGDDGTPADSSNAAPIDGERLYTMNCGSCHGPDGKLGASGATDLSTSTITETGQREIINKGKGRMMPFQSMMTADEIEAVIQHINTLRQ